MKLHIIGHVEWGMPPLDDNHETRTFSVIMEANVHHSDSVAPLDHADCAEVVRGFDSYHRSKGWAGVGYNRIICSHGYVFIGRPRNVIPAAAENHNTPIIAYCLIAKGNQRATPNQLRALVAMRERDGEAVGHSLSWSTHKSVEPPGYTECPGKGIQEQIDLLRNGRTVEQVIKRGH